MTKRIIMRTKLISSVAILVAAFLVATNPVVADAAKQITGKQIKDNSVTGKDVKESTLKKVPNAKKLNGAPADKYLDRVAQTTNPSSVAVPGGTFPRVLGPLSLTVPKGIKFARVTVTAGFTGGTTTVTAWFQVDNDNCSVTSSFGFDNRPFGDTTPTQTTLNYSLIVPVTPGVHSFVLCVFASGASTSRFNSLNVETIAGGSAGGTTLKAAPRPRDTDADVGTAR